MIVAGPLDGRREPRVPSRTRRGSWSSSAPPIAYRLEAELAARRRAAHRPRRPPRPETSTRPGARSALGADRRYTGPDCPPEMLEEGGIPQGDYVPVPWLLSAAGRRWVETVARAWSSTWAADGRSSPAAAAGPLRLHLFCDPTPAARLRRYLRLTGCPGASGVGLRALEEPRRLRAPARRRGGLPRLREHTCRSTRS